MSFWFVQLRRVWMSPGIILPTEPFPRLDFLCYITWKGAQVLAYILALDIGWIWWVLMKLGLNDFHQSFFLELIPAKFLIDFNNSSSASHDNWCTGTLLNRIITSQWEDMGDVGSARYEPALLPPCLIIRVLSFSNCPRSMHSKV